MKPIVFTAERVTSTWQGHTSLPGFVHSAFELTARPMPAVHLKVIVLAEEICREVQGLDEVARRNRLGWESPSQRAKVQTCQLLNDVAAEIQTLPMPNVTLTADAEVLIEWWSESKKLSLYVGDDGACMVQVGLGEGDSVESFDVSDARDLCRGLGWLTGRLVYTSNLLEHST